MTSIRLPEKIENRLASLCQLTKRSKSFYIKEAIEYYLEDLEDAYIALERMADPRRELLTTKEVIEELKNE